MADETRNIRLDATVADASQIPGALLLEISYLKRTEGLSEAVREEIQAFVNPSEAAAAIDIPAAHIGSEIDVRVLTPSRIQVATRRYEVSQSLSDLQLDLSEVETEEIRGVYSAVTEPIPSFTRRVRLVPISGSGPDFVTSELNLARIDPDVDWSGMNLDDVFAGEAPQTIAISLAERQSVPVADWERVSISIDGRFEVEIVGDEPHSWIWWLSGADPALGVIVNEQGGANVSDLVVPIPASGSGHIVAQACGDHQSPLEFDEREMTDNPGAFSEDPGAYCQPFSNPERILSERVFHVILRADQPTISGEYAYRLQAERAQRAAERVPAAEPVRGRFLDFWRRVFKPSQVVHAEVSFTPLSGWPFSPTKPRRTGRQTLTSDNPLDWEGDTARYQATSIARGHILEYRARWRSNGYSLGQVVSTLTLAPRQAKWVETIDWERSERTEREERSTFREETSDSVHQSRDYDNVVESSLKEWSQGASASRSSSAAAGIGGFFKGIIFGGGVVSGKSSSGSAQASGRSASAREHQRLRDSIRRYGDSLREMRSSVVQEVSQHETVTGSKEMIYNPNFGRSLTMIYHQINRHLKVSTEFAGVRECLFVPLSITDFTLERAMRWKEILAGSLIDRSHREAMKHITDIATDFENSDIRSGTRAQEPVRRLTGSLFIDLAIERPGSRRAEDIEFNDDDWQSVQSMVMQPSRGIFERLKELKESKRDEHFQRHVAPLIAESWAKGLSLSIWNNPDLPVRFRLASGYHFGRTLRIDFELKDEAVDAFTRSEAQVCAVHAANALPPGSRAEIVGIKCNYATKRFRRSVKGLVRRGHLVDLETGKPEPTGQGALALLPLDEWENYNQRQALREAGQNLLAHLNEHVEHYHKEIWWRMDRDRLYMMLDGFYVPGTDNVSVASVVEREPIAIAGNCIVFRVAAGAFVGWGEYDTPTLLYEYYKDTQPERDALHIAFPTPGIYAQAIMDPCIALEEHNGDTSWVLNDKHPLLESFDSDLLSSRRTDPADVTPSDFPTTMVNLQNAPTMPSPSGLEDAFSLMGKAGIFRDMAGLEGTQENVRKAMDVSSKLADSFGDKALKLHAAQYGTENANKRLESIEKAKDKGLIDDEKAKDLAGETLKDMTVPEEPAQDPSPVAELIASADPQRMQSIEAKDDDYQVSMKTSEPDASEAEDAPTPPTLPSGSSSSGDKFEEMKIEDGVDNYHVNHCVAFFKLPASLDPISPEKFTRDLRANFVNVFNPNLASVESGGARHFNGEPVLKFTMLNPPDLAPPHDDWVRLPHMYPGDATFMAGTLKRESDIGLLDGAFDWLAAQFSQYHFLAGRRSWAVGQVPDSDLWFVETAALDRISGWTVQLMAKLSMGDVDAFKAFVPLIWSRMLANFSSVYGVTFETAEMTDYTMPQIDSYPISPTNIYWREGESETLEGAKSLAWFAPILSRHPHLDQ